MLVLASEEIIVLGTPLRLNSFECFYRLNSLVICIKSNITVIFDNHVIQVIITTTRPDILKSNRSFQRKYNRFRIRINRRHRFQITTTQIFGSSNSEQQILIIIRSLTRFHIVFYTNDTHFRLFIIYRYKTTVSASIIRHAGIAISTIKRRITISKIIQLVYIPTSIGGIKTFTSKAITN